MTKVFALLSIAAVFAFASCGEKKEVTTETDSTTVVVPVDTTAAVVDTAAVAPVDTTVKH